MKRLCTALGLIVAIALIHVPHTRAFSDVLLKHPNSVAIAYLRDNGIFTGYSDGTFGMGKPINRAELIKVLVLASGNRPSAATYKDCFADVQDQWFAAPACFAKEKGWIKGYEDGTFKPGNNVSDVEAIKMVIETQSISLINELVFQPFYDIDMNAWFAPYVATAKDRGMLQTVESSFNPGTTITREWIAELMFRAIVLRLSDAPVFSPDAAIAVFQNKKIELPPAPTSEDGSRPPPAVSATAVAPEQRVPPAFDGTVLDGIWAVALETSQGEITMILDANRAPNTVTNFVRLAQAGYYDDLLFHRVIPAFMIQGGDPKGNGTGGASIYGPTFPDEPNNIALNRGVVAMANSGPNTNGSQFFIINAPAGTPWLQGKHTAFGIVVKGMEVVDAISEAERNDNDKPLEPITFVPKILGKIEQ